MQYEPNKSRLIAGFLTKCPFFKVTHERPNALFRHNWIFFIYFSWFLDFTANAPFFIWQTGHWRMSPGSSGWVKQEIMIKSHNQKKITQEIIWIKGVKNVIYSKCAALNLTALLISFLGLLVCVKEEITIEWISQDKPQRRKYE